jgi:hypothetical protein
MPRVFCPSCWQLVNADAKECPQCGRRAPFRASKPKQSSIASKVCKRTVERCVQTGVSNVQLLPANLLAESCDAAFALKDMVIPISQLPTLPLPGCDALKCQCIWTGHLDP